MTGKPEGMTTIERSVDIAAPPQKVWELLEDVRRLPEYSDGTDEVRDAPERLTRVGQRFVQVGRLLGLKIKSKWEVVDIRPGSLLRSVGTLAPAVRYTLTQRLEPIDGGTRLGVVIEYKVPGGALGRFAAAAGAEDRAGSEAQAVLEGIKRTVEAA